MHTTDTTYHRSLRIGAVVLALMLVFQSGLVSDATQDMAGETQRYLANVIGVGASVAPTELNQITAELTARERELDAREAALADREIEVGLSEPRGIVDSETTTYILASILFILLVLILLNYVLDYLRTKERQEQGAV